MTTSLLSRLSSTRLRFRLVMIYCGSLAAVMLVLVLHATYLHASLAGNLAYTHARELAQNIAGLSISEVASNDRIGLARKLESFNEFESIRTIAITDRLGVPLAAVRRNAAGNLSATPSRAISIEFRAEGERTRRSSSLTNRESETIWIAIGQIAPIGWVGLEYATEPAQIARDRMFAATGAMALLLLCVASLLFVCIARRKRHAPASKAVRTYEPSTPAQALHAHRHEPPPDRPNG